MLSASSVHREVGQKGLHVVIHHSSRMLLPVEKDKALNPVEVRLLGADAIML